MLNPGDSFGDYRVIRLLGKGGMGSVFLLENAEGAQVAAKILDPATAGDHESRRRFLREAELALGVKRSIDPEKLRDPDPTRAVQKTLDVLFPGWKTSEIGNSGSLGYWHERDGERNVLCTHPPRRGVPAVLSKTLVVEGKSPVLHVRIANNELGSQFRLRVRVAGKVIREKDVVAGWTDVYVDLRRWRGKKVKIDLEHLPTGWCREWAFWSAIEVVDDATIVEVAAVQGAETPVNILDRMATRGGALAAVGDSVR